MKEVTGKSGLTKKVIRLLLAHGIPHTQQRVVIGEILFVRDQHLSAEQVQNRINERGNVSVSKATVYNTLKLFACKGLVREVIVDPSKVFYDSNPATHHHYYNVDTGTLVDIDGDKIDLNRLPPMPEGSETEVVDVVIRVRER